MAEEEDLFFLAEEDLEPEEENFPFPHTVVLVMGLDEAGKTALLGSLIYGEIVNTMATELRESQRYTHEGVEFVMREIGGRFRFRDDWESQFDDARALIWVIDAIDRGRIIESREEFDKVIAHPKLSGIPLILAINKQDARLKMEFDDIMNRMDIGRLEDRKVKVVKTSKKACYELVEAMQWLVDELDLKPGRGNDEDVNST